MEMRILMTNGGQLLTGVTIRVPAETHKAVILVHAPVGLYLPAGLQLLVDDAQVEKLELQTCDNSGCYAGGELTDKTIAALRAGQSLAVVFQDLNKKPISVPVPLNGFSAAYQSIK